MSISNLILRLLSQNTGQLSQNNNSLLHVFGSPEFIRLSVKCNLVVEKKWDKVVGPFQQYS